MHSESDIFIYSTSCVLVEIILGTVQVVFFCSWDPYLFFDKAWWITWSLPSFSFKLTTCNSKSTLCPYIWLMSILFVWVYVNRGFKWSQLHVLCGFCCRLVCTCMCVFQLRATRGSRRARIGIRFQSHEKVLSPPQFWRQHSVIIEYWLIDNDQQFSCRCASSKW